VFNERMNFAETTEMLEEINKNLNKIVIITDITETSNSVVAKIKEAKLPEMAFRTNVVQSGIILASVVSRPFRRL
jgi:ribonucleotide monophosphatase NagD (HAD superfamily)